MSDHSRDGKRGIRVYPRWNVTTNKQAQKTQAWQTHFFIDLTKDEQIDVKKAKRLVDIALESSTKKPPIPSWLTQ